MRDTSACGESRRQSGYQGPWPIVPTSVRVAQPILVFHGKTPGYAPTMAADDTSPPLWRAILARLDPPPESHAIDAVLAALENVVGRGTLQRIRDGTGRPQMNVMRALASRLGCDVTELIREAGGAPITPAPRRAVSPKTPTLGKTCVTRPPKRSATSRTKNQTASLRPATTDATAVSARSTSSQRVFARSRWVEA